LLLDLPVDSYSETVAFPAMPDYAVDEPLLMIAGLDPMQRLDRCVHRESGRLLMGRPDALDHVTRIAR